MQDEIKLLKEENDSMQSKLDQCESGNQDAIITHNELDSCRGELTDEKNSKQRIYQDLQSSKRNIETLEDDKKVLQNQLNSEKVESDRLRDRIRKLENENQRLNSANQNLPNSPDLCQLKIKSIQSKLDQCQSGWINQLRDQPIAIDLAYSGMNLWDQNFVNGRYVIAYELNSDLDSKIKLMLPKVRS